MWVACTWRSSRITGAWALLRPRQSARSPRWLPTWAAAGWLFMITITCWVTFFDSCAASAGVIGRCATLAAVTAADADAPATSDCPASGAGMDAAAAIRTATLLLATLYASSHFFLILEGGPRAGRISVLRAAQEAACSV